MRVLVLDTETEILDIREIKDDLDTYYEIIGCDCIDMPERKIGDHYYDIICDDEGLLKSDPIVSAVDEKLQPMLVGTLIICKHDDKGNTIGLTDDEIREVMSYQMGVIQLATGNNLVVLKMSY